MRSITEVDSEQVLLSFFIVVAGAMFIQANDYPYFSRVFPQLVAGATIIGSALLLFQSYLPEPIRRAVIDSRGLFEAEQASFEEELETREDQPDRIPEAGETTPEISDIDRPISPSTFLMLLIVAYAIASYLFSLLVVSPLLVVVYLTWYRTRWLIVAALTLIIFLVTLSFEIMLNAPVDRGVLIGELLTVIVV